MKDKIISSGYCNLKLFFLLVFLQISVIYPQSAQGNKDFFKRDVNLVLEDGKQLIQSPSKWETSDWLKFSAVIGGTALLSTIDEKAQDLAYRNPDYSQSFPMKLGKWYGEPLITGAFASGFYVYGLIAKDEPTRRIGLEVAESFAYAGLITTVLKVAIGRERPYTHKGRYSFLPFTRPLSPGANEHFSLPSGHSTVAFSLATVLASHTNNYLLKTVIYTPAVLTTVSRVYQDQHWVSDVFMGAAIGYFVGSFIVDHHASKDEKNSSVLINYNAPGLISLTIPF